MKIQGFHQLAQLTLYTALFSKRRGRLAARQVGSVTTVLVEQLQEAGIPLTEPEATLLSLAEPRNPRNFCVFEGGGVCISLTDTSLPRVGYSGTVWQPPSYTRFGVRAVSDTQYALFSRRSCKGDGTRPRHPRGHGRADVRRHHAARRPRAGLRARSSGGCAAFDGGSSWSGKGGLGSFTWFKVLSSRTVWCSAEDIFARTPAG